MNEQPPPTHLPSQQVQPQLSRSTGLPGPAGKAVTYMPAHSTATGASGAASVHRPAESICCASCWAACCGGTRPDADLASGCLGLSCLPSCLLYIGKEPMSRWLPAAGALLNIEKGADDLYTVDQGCNEWECSPSEQPKTKKGCRVTHHCVASPATAVGCVT